MNKKYFENIVKNGKKALIAMSGGVDSSVAAYLTLKAGYDPVGATMHLYDNDMAGISGGKTCCSLNDVEDARSVAFSLGIPFYVFNFKDEFEKEVIRRFVDSYEKGLTPNPCIDCNRYIKFSRLFTRCSEMKMDCVVTGHYARIQFDSGSGRYLLMRAADETKDQSYVLFSLTQEQLAHTLFPLGGMHKAETRELAESLGFVNARKHDSQDICFVPDGDYSSFIRRYSGREYPPGDFVYKDGTVLGRHRGIIGYTIGQRKGLGLALPHPLYVCSKDIEHNCVILGENEDLFSRRFEAAAFNWIACETPAADIRAEARIRYSQQAFPASVTPLGEDRVMIEFDTPQRAITKGQAVVLYDGDVVVGGGTIV